MLQRAIDKKNFNKLIAAMLKEGSVRGPLAGSKGTLLGDLSGKSEFSAAYANFKLPPKREFFPQCEVISKYTADGVTEAIVQDRKTVLFGVRPCDTQALEYFDVVFNDERYVDPYYQQRRENTLIISLACDKPASSCFCSSTGGSPVGKAGTDIVSFDLNDSIVFEAVSEKGEAFLKKNQDLFREPTSQEIRLRTQQETDSLKALSKIPVSDVPEMIQKKDTPAFWDSIAETCLSCGACTYLCPTCHCFDLFDDKLRDGGQKLRVHDACMFAAFTREASGHNPRSKPGERMRQRVMHKFSYSKENFDKIFCVGCGRCVINCPSNIDIRETVSKVTT